MRISDGSSDVCSSDLWEPGVGVESDRAVDDGAVGLMDHQPEAVRRIRNSCSAVIHAVPDDLTGGTGSRLVEQRSHHRPIRVEARKRGVSGKSVSVRVDLGGRRSIQKKKHKTNK